MASNQTGLTRDRLRAITNDGRGVEGEDEDERVLDPREALVLDLLEYEVLAAAGRAALEADEFVVFDATNASPRVREHALKRLRARGLVVAETSPMILVYWGDVTPAVES